MNGSEYSEGNVVRRTAEGDAVRECSQRML